MGLPAPDRTIAWNGKVPPRGGTVVVIESVPLGLDLTGSEGAERGVGQGSALGALSPIPPCRVGDGKTSHLQHLFAATGGGDCDDYANNTTYGEGSDVHIAALHCPSGNAGGEAGSAQGGGDPCAAALCRRPDGDNGDDGDDPAGGGGADRVRAHRQANAGDASDDGDNPAGDNPAGGGAEAASGGGRGRRVRRRGGGGRGRLCRLGRRPGRGRRDGRRRGELDRRGGRGRGGDGGLRVDDEAVSLIVAAVLKGGRDVAEESGGLIGLPSLIFVDRRRPLDESQNSLSGPGVPGVDVVVIGQNELLSELVGGELRPPWWIELPFTII